MNYSVDICHNRLMERKPLLAFDEANDFESWKAQVAAKLTECLGDMPEAAEPCFRIEWTKEHETFTEHRFLFSSEKEVEVPCHLWIPKAAKKPCPVVICLQGHSTGMHISMGRPIYEGDANTISGGDRDFAVRIVQEGYAALVIEQRAFGERRSEIQLKTTPDYKITCPHPSLTAILLGRTMIGERAWDVSRAIDQLENFPEIDMERIAMMGNSGGGTATYYTACVEPRIKVAMPSCSVCTYRDSITAMSHCTCNYIPGIAKYVDMGELAALIAPRKLIVVAGAEDPIFPIHGVHETFDKIEKIYEKAGAAGQCRLVIGDGGHRFYADASWPVFKELTNW